MAYREPAPVECESCLKRKVKSPKVSMSRAAKNWLRFAALVMVIAGETAFLGTFTASTPGYIAAPSIVIFVATIVAGIAVFAHEASK